MENTSASLLGRLRDKGSPEDWGRLVAIYRPFVERFIRMDPALASDAEDISQEVMRKLVEHLPRFQRQRDGAFRAWLKTITVNEVNLYWRRRLRRGAIVGEAGREVLNELADPRNELSRQWDREHSAHVLSRLQELIEHDFSPSTWEAFRLRVFEGMTTDEVAAKLRTSKNSVDIAKSRVLARLRKEAADLIEN